MTKAMIPSYAIILCIEIHIRQRSTKIVDIPIYSLNYPEDHRAEDTLISPSFVLSLVNRAVEERRPRFIGPNGRPC